MNFFSRLAAIAIFMLTAATAMPNELKCSVEINADKVQNTAGETFSSLKEAISEYLNTTAFTTAQYSPVEKIECRLFFTVNDYTDNTVSGTLQIQSSRPVYGSSYTTTLLNFKDNDISFAYTPGDRIVHSLNSVESSLSTLLDFYAYLIIGLDGDSFAPKGGDGAYELAAQIMQLARNTGDKGWRAIDDNRNRASLLTGITEGASSAIRTLYYDYHRKGLDIMSVSPDKGRAAITEALGALPGIAQAAPMSVILSMFRDTKLDELTNVYSKGSRDERDKVYKMLVDIYPTEAARLEPIKESKD